MRATGRGVLCAQLAALIGAAAVSALTPGGDHWLIGPFATVAVFTIATDLAAVRTAGGMYVSGSFLGVVLASVTLGGGPAALVAVAAIGVGWLRSRDSAHVLRANLAIYAWFPLITGIGFHVVTRWVGAGTADFSFYLLVFVAFVAALGLNFGLTATYQAFVTAGSSISHMVKEVLVPLLSAELFSALLTVLAVYVYVNAGTMGLAFCGLVFLVFQYLVGELLKSQRRGQALRRTAVTDELTGLSNRERFMEIVAERIAAVDADGHRFSVLLMDLDRFKEINDTLGHHHGDVLLRELGPRLEAALGRGGVVARLGGDEFGLLPPQDSDDPAVLEIVISRLFTMLAEPFRIEDLSLEVGASVGVARYPSDGADANALLRCADVAMYNAKEAQTEYKLYEAGSNQHSVRRLSVLSEMRHALASDEIVVHFQPIIELSNQRVRGAEGLVRWQHPEHGLIPPGAFVQTVEQTGLIGPLTRHVLERSIAECAAWRRDGRELSVA
ncbi:MAG: putative bifunctional diguanylate cyclase/phosphodiesterase, partial [Solirubrobacteraceae bacterium]